MPEVFAGLVRHLLTAGAGVLVTKGLIDAGSAEILVGSLIGLIGVGLSVWAKLKA